MVKARVCKHCGSIVPDGHFYCGRCGTRYTEKEEGEGKRQTLFFSAMQAPGKAKLILIKGEGLDGISFHLNATEHIVGRTSCSIPFPDDGYLSSKHANFYYKDNQLYLKDESSLNGTFLKLQQPYPLSDGEEFISGEHRFRFELMTEPSQFTDQENTKLYVSPSRGGTFRVVQIMDGRIPGLCYSSPNDEVMIGREGCDMSFPDDAHMSRMNTKVSQNGQEHILEDLSSKNGTYINITGDTPLSHGDYVFAGAQLLRIEITEE